MCSLGMCSLVLKEHCWGRLFLSGSFYNIRKQTELIAF